MDFLLTNQSIYIEDYKIDGVLGLGKSQAN